jgi:hypothetical protein
MLKVGDKLPAGSLQEYVEVEGNGCSLGPNAFDVEKSTAGKTVAIFGLPGAFTPTCSAKHVPGYVAKADEFKAAGVDEIWCVSVNDPFVMGAWGRDAGPDRARHGDALAALLDARQGRRRQGAERRGVRQVRGERRRHAAEAGHRAALKGFPGRAFDAPARFLA